MIRIITLGVCCGLFIWFGAVSASADPILTPQQAVSEMTWGVNLTTLYMADKVYEEGEGNSLGYVTNAPVGVGIWFWDNSNLLQSAVPDLVSGNVQAWCVFVGCLCLVCKDRDYGR